MSDDAIDHQQTISYQWRRCLRVNKGAGHNKAAQQEGGLLGRVIVDHNSNSNQAGNMARLFI
ncbi:hypothetical protein [Aeromonas cavernicola]|uniref:hypothetical protein n=1 Tax=Aeromonas cavernicola TaxID=1006623 RepID=UPI0012FE2EAE|nr:hypothetical protein [Aeromonas cavernicola]